MTEQLKTLCEDFQVRAHTTRLPETAELAKDWAPGARHFKVKLTMDGREMTVPRFSQGSAHKRPPTAADVLYCVISDANAGELSFEEFCADLGYDTDSRKAEQVWLSCREMVRPVREFLGPHFERFARAEH